MKQRVMKTSATVLVTLYGMLALTSSMTALQTLETELLLTNNFGLLLSTQLSELTAVASGTAGNWGRGLSQQLQDLVVLLSLFVTANTFGFWNCSPQTAGTAASQHHHHHRETKAN